MKIWLVIGAILLVLGSTVFAVVMTVNRWDFTKLNTVNYETNTYSLSEAVRNISVKTDTADIVFVPSDDGTCQVVCYEAENVKHSVAVRDGTLIIDVVDERKWYEYIGIAIGAPKVSVYLPEGEYGVLSLRERTGDVEVPNAFHFESIDIALSTGDVELCASASDRIKIKTSTGDIRLANVQAENIELSASTGDVTVSGAVCRGDVKINVSTGETYLSDVTCRSVISDGNTGSIILKNVIAAGKFLIERSTGDVTFEKCDAGELSVETDTGDVKGTLLTDKIFFVESDTGFVSVPKTSSGGRCEIETDTGNINIKILGKN